MSLLSQTASNVEIETNRSENHDSLLALTMACMSFADGIFKQSEVDTIQAFASTLPEFSGNYFNAPWVNAMKIYNQCEGNMERIVPYLKGLDTPNLRRKAFILAVDVAFSSGDVDETEDRLLENIRTTLEIDDIFAEKTIQVLATKYAR